MTAFDIRKTGLARRDFLGLAAAAGALASVCAIAPAYAREPEIFTRDAPGVAVGGYDPVAYFTQGKPVKGSPQFSTDWNGAKWQFASAENLAAFKAAPERYAPQYGGYCAYAVSQGGLAPGDPEQWSIKGGKLYLNLSSSIRRTWLLNAQGYIVEADRNWPRVLEN